MSRFKERVVSFTDRLPGGRGRQERRLLVPEGPLCEERQAFMDVAREAFKDVGFGELRWNVGSVNMASQEAPANYLDHVWSYLDAGFPNFSRHEAESQFVEGKYRRNPYKYRLSVALRGTTVAKSDVVLGLSYGASDSNEGRKKAVTVVLDPNGQLKRANESAQERATTENVQLVLRDATAFLEDVLQRPEWQTKPKGLQYQPPGWNLAVVGG